MVECMILCGKYRIISLFLCTLYLYAHYVNNDDLVFKLAILYKLPLFVYIDLLSNVDVNKKAAPCH